MSRSTDLDSKQYASSVINSGILSSGGNVVGGGLTTDRDGGCIGGTFCRYGPWVVEAIHPLNLFLCVYTKKLDALSVSAALLPSHPVPARPQPCLDALIPSRTFGFAYTYYTGDLAVYLGESKHYCRIWIKRKIGEVGRQ